MFFYLCLHIEHVPQLKKIHSKPTTLLTSTDVAYCQIKNTVFYIIKINFFHFHCFAVYKNFPVLVLSSYTSVNTTWSFLQNLKVPNMAGQYNWWKVAWFLFSTHCYFFFSREKHTSMLCFNKCHIIDKKRWILKSRNY